MRSRQPDDLETLLFKWRRRFWLATAIVVFLVGDVALWRFGPPTFALSIPDKAIYGLYASLTERAARALMSGDPSTIATGASFSVSAGTFPTQQRAEVFATALDASGVPVLVRTQSQEGQYQVLVGPYVSTDETEQVQRALAAWGLGEARLVVDDTMRGRPQRASMFGGGDAAGDGVLIVSAPGMASVVFEMRSAPREVEARRTSATTLDIDIGRVTDGGGSEVLHMPEGVQLVNELIVEATGSHGGRHARLVIPEGVRSRLRLEGRRVYVDLAWPTPPWQVGDRAPRATQSARAPQQRQDPQPDASEQESQDAGQGEYREQLRTAVDRFHQVQPFLLSAIDAPDTQVLGVLSRTLDEISGSLAVATPPSDLAASHQLLLSSVVEASRAMAPIFAGDRRAAAQQAIAKFEAAQK